MAQPTRSSHLPDGTAANDHAAVPETTTTAATKPDTSAVLSPHDSASTPRDSINNDNEKASSTSPVDPSIGVSKVEAFNKVLYQSGRSGKTMLWLLAVSIGLTMFAYALDQGLTSSVFTTMATSTFGVHSQLAAVATASQIIRAISKPFIGKLADITSRPTTYVIILVFYAIGFAVAASSSTFAAYTVGICFTSVGKSGLDLLSDIIIGDLTPLEWRGFFGATLSLPFVVTVPINGFIGEAFAGDNWRWGLGMFAIIVPVLLMPAILTLYSMQRKGEKMGMVTMAASKRVRVGGDEEGTEQKKKTGFKYWLGLLYTGLVDIDIVGLVILGFAFGLILLPFSLAERAAGGWRNGGMIAMIVIGFVLLFVFTAYEVWLAPVPLMTKRILRNRTFLAAAVIYTFNQMSSSVRNTYFSSYVWIIKDWTSYQWIIFLGITTMGLSLLGPVVGLVQRYTHRYKTMMLFGAASRLLGFGLLINVNGTMTQSTARLVVSQLIYCLGSFNVVGVRVGSQASVPHEDMASVIALLTLWSTLGSSIGSAVSSAIWTEEMLARMKMELPNTDAKTIAKLYASIKTLHSAYPFDSPVRQGAIRAYAFVNGHITLTALMLAVVPLIATLFMPDFYLGKQQNAVTNTGLDGEKVEVPESAAKVHGKSSGVDVLSSTSGAGRWLRRCVGSYRK